MEKIRLYFDFWHILYLKFGIPKWNRKCGALPVIDNPISLEKADYSAENPKEIRTKAAEI